jgi:hypothetical protein
MLDGSAHALTLAVRKQDPLDFLCEVLHTVEDAPAGVGQVADHVFVNVAEVHHVLEGDVEDVRESRSRTPYHSAFGVFLRTGCHRTVTFLVIV